MDTCLPQSSNFLSILTGSFSTPSGQNPTVAMIEAAYQHQGINARYINCEVKPEGLRGAVRGAIAMNWSGFNCSLPHKVAVIDLLDELDPAARMIGAVNCVAIRNNKLIGYNTDGQGFMKSLRTQIDPRGKSMLVLGAGGAARAIAVEAAIAGVASLRIVNRDRTRGEALARHIQDETTLQVEFCPWDHPCTVPESVDIVINASSVGLYPNHKEMPDVDVASLRSHMIVADVIPNPPRTALIASADAADCKTLDGLGMLVNQGVASVQHWLGVEVSASVMRQRLVDIFL